MLRRGLQARAPLAAVLLAVGFATGCGDGGGGRDVTADAAPAGFSPVADVEAGSTPRAPLAVDVDLDIQVDPPPDFARYPALDAAVRAEAQRLRAAFEADAGTAAAGGGDVADWTLRLDWRVLRGNRYLWVVEGDGAAVHGSAGRRPLRSRLAWDGIDKRTVTFGEWFVPASWPAVVDAVRAVDPALAADGDALRDIVHAPVFGAEGPVIGFDLERAADAPVRLPRDAVEAAIDPAKRVLLDAAAAGS